MFCKKLEIKNKDSFEIGEIVSYKFRKWIYKGVKMRKAILKLKEGEKPFCFGQKNRDCVDEVIVFFSQVRKIDDGKQKQI